MQKGGFKKSLEEVHPEGSTMERDVRSLHGESLRTALSGAFKRRKPIQAHDMELPTNEDMGKHIHNIFSHWKATQTSEKVNAGAAIADSVSLWLMTSGNVLFGAGALASEGLTHWKNSRDAGTPSELKDRELFHLKLHERRLLLELKSKLSATVNESKKKELEELMKETEKLFSNIEKMSKKGLKTTLGSRLEGFAGSALAFPATFHPYSPYRWLVDWASNYFSEFMHVQPIQIPPYNPDPIIAAASLGIQVTAYIAMSTLITLGIYAGRNESAKYSYDSRDADEKYLKNRMGVLLDEIYEKCGVRP